ncbi:MAG: MmgE/PrpD family protein [Kiritimatiellae bacterium]|nr:MmgE/PrpD family protein [Kiritimatiellia bacterium]
MNRTEEFLSALDAVRAREVPGEVMARARRSLLDYLAVTCAGAAFQRGKLERYFAAAMPEAGASAAIGTRRRFTLKEAVFLNGLNGHALDYDDGTNSGIIHLGSPVFSLLLPLAERGGKTVEEVLRAAVLGYEASYTLAVTIQPEHKARGFHATGTCGTPGAALAAAELLGFGGEERFRVFAAACAASSGMLSVLDEGSELKPYNVAKAAALALDSLWMGSAGFRVHPDSLGGARGFLKMMAGRADVELKPVLLGGTYAIMKTYTKPYASCRYTHPAVEAAIRLRGQVAPDEVEGIAVKTYSLAVAGHDHTEVKGPYSAKMSIPFSTAAGLLCGKAGLQEFSEESVARPDLLELARKVRVEADEGFSEAFPGRQTAEVTARTARGEFTARVDFPKGEPENPLTDAEFRERYDGLMEYAGVDGATRNRIFDAVMAGTGMVAGVLEGL